MVTYDLYVLLDNHPDVGLQMTFYTDTLNGNPIHDWKVMPMFVQW